jgi:hypothetical protein
MRLRIPLEAELLCCMKLIVWLHLQSQTRQLVQLEESYILDILSLGTAVAILSSFETGEDRNVQNNISASYRVLV